jgi:anti-sigma B factor antagonist
MMYVRSRKLPDGITIVSVHGYMMSGPQLGALHRKVSRIVAKGYRWIILDLGRVEWMNSAGLGALISCLTTCRDAGGDMSVARVTRKVNSLFMITQVIKVFDTFDKLGDAVWELRLARERVEGSPIDHRSRPVWDILLRRRMADSAES